jgi:hypothetical protein
MVLPFSDTYSRDREGSVTVTVEVPERLADARTAALARELLVLDAVRSERLSWRAGAVELGLSPWEFLDLARDHGVPVARFDLSDWQDDMKALERLGHGRRAE